MMRGLFIDPGRFRTELALEQCEKQPDGLGGHTEQWMRVATVFAEVEPVSIHSRHAAGQAVSTVTHRITMRWRNGVAGGMRLTRDGRVFEIVTVHDRNENGRYLVCRTREQGR